VAADGSVYEFGHAAFHGSLGDRRLSQAVAGVTATRSGRGYWLVAADGGIFAFGDAGFFGSTGAVRLNRLIVGMAATPSGGGYWLVAADGGIFAFGDAGFFGSTGAVRLNKPIVGMAATRSGGGYWLVAADGGIFAFGDAGFFGSTGGAGLNKPIVGMAPTATGRGYWFVAADGGVFSFGDAAFLGSVGGRALPRPVVSMNGLPAGDFVPGDPSFPRVGQEPLPGAPGPPAAPFAVGLIGDTGYSQAQDAALLRLRRDINSEDVAFVVHDGDIWGEGNSCSDAGYAATRDVFDGFAHPFLYTPGDNEWADCTSSSSGRLSSIRDFFFPAAETLGRRRMTVTRQDGRAENGRWVVGGVVFATINEPGPAGSIGRHQDENLDWLDAAFDEAEATGAAGVMIIWHDNPFEPSGGRLARTLKARTVAFGHPVVLVHGDTHQHRIDHPWHDVDHFTRVETHGDTTSASWVRAVIDPSTPTVFDFEEG
jgi:hypothetical protein